MTIHLEKYGFSLLLPPKCGSSTLKNLAFELENGYRYKPLIRNGLRFHIHDLYPTKYFKLERLKMAKLPGAVRMCVVRSPLERVISCYSNRVLFHGELDNIELSFMERFRGLTRRPDFTNFVLNLDKYAAKSASVGFHLDPLTKFLGEDPTIYDAIFDLSELDALIERIRELVGHDLPALGAYQTGGAQHKPASVSDEERELIESAYAQDYEIYGAWFRAADSAVVGDRATGGI